MEKLSFQERVNQSNLADAAKGILQQAYRFLHDESLPMFTSRSLLFNGDTGVGKTYMAEQLLKDCKNWQLIVAGATRLSGENVKRLDNLKDIVLAFKTTPKAAVFIDDLDYVAEKEDCEYIFKDKKLLMELLEELRSRNDAFLIVTVNNVYLDWELFDRFDAKIEAKIPSNHEKESFLAAYGAFLPKKLMKPIITQSFGYNYRDLAEVTRMAYRFGNEKITRVSLNKALSTYTPGSMRGFLVLRNLDTRFSSLIGSNQIKNKLNKLIAATKKPMLAKRLGLKRQNLLLFTGPNGTGKTLMAKALAGELQYPLININAALLSRRGPLSELATVFDMAKRHKRSVVVVDEADKLLGRDILGDDSVLIGALNELVDGLNGAPESFIVLITNNDVRLGMGLADRFTKLEFKCPGSPEREEFFKRKACKAKLLDPEITETVLAKATEGKSFREMEKLWEEIVEHYIETNESVGSQEFSEIKKAIKKEDEELEMFG